MTKYTYEIEATVNEPDGRTIRLAQPGETPHQHSVYRRAAPTRPRQFTPAEWLADCGTAETAALLVAALGAKQRGGIIAAGL